MSMAMTVLGPVPVEDLGSTLSHEHIAMSHGCGKVWHVDPSSVPGMPLISAEAPLSIELYGALRRSPSVLWDNFVLPEEDVMCEELMYFKAAGGGCVIDVDCIGIRGDVTVLRRISERTGLHIVASTGFYLSQSWPEYVHKASADQLAKVMIDEYENGIDDTGIHPGIIGEIGTSTLTLAEEKLLRAAAQASQATGLAVSVHTNVDQRHGMRIVDILIEEGMSPDRIIMTHLGENTFECRADVLERYPEQALAYLDYTKAILDRGVVGAFDGFGKEYYLDEFGWALTSDTQRIAAVLKLIDMGYSSQLVLSHDVWQKSSLHRYGGLGYDHIHAHIIPRLRAQGVSEGDIHQMMVRTPARLLACSS